MTDEKLKYAHLSGIVAARSNSAVKEEDDEDEKVSAKADDDEDAKAKAKSRSKADDDEDADEDEDKKSKAKSKAKKAKADDGDDDEDDKEKAEDDDDDEDKKDKSSKKSKARTYRDGVRAERDRCSAIFAGANPSYLSAAAEMAFSTDMPAEAVLRVLATFPSIAAATPKRNSLASVMAQVKNPEIAPEADVRFEAGDTMAVVDFVRKSTKRV